ncbi:hypothetical protein EB796_011243 [Bugula neritina]|uniref:Uncharacterized protein n=1 Tax=Bugula neritina TaxID=10212 RepID=A0A7J7JVP1_BUGNE|nr:hypothetical protein EB796_011243 [Bugula neritina]
MTKYSVYYTAYSTFSDSEEDWGDWDKEAYPYGCPQVHYHPMKTNSGFIPAELHRPSYLPLFVEAAKKPVIIEEGQFEDALVDLIDTGMNI